MTTTYRSFFVPSTRPIYSDDDFRGLPFASDEWAVRMIAEHRALSTDQLLALGFYLDAAAAEKRLKRLTKRGWLERIGPGFTGHAYLDGTVWCLGPLGLALCPLDNKPTTAAKAYRDRERLFRDRRLAHLLTTNQFFVDLATYARTHPGTDLRTWWSPRTCRQATATPRHETWHGEYLHDGRRVRFWLEPDDGTTLPATLAARIHRYHHLADRTGVPSVLFPCTTGERETHLRHHLARLNLVGLDVATSHRGLGHPATQVWQSMNSQHRVALHELPEHHLTFDTRDDFLYDQRSHAPHPILDPYRPGDESIAEGDYS